jgi:hypothetical protein
LIVPSVLIALADVSDGSGDELAGIMHTHIGVAKIRGYD